MQLYDIKPIFEATNLTPEAFPMLTGALTERSRPKYDEVLADIKNFLKAGELIKSEFARTKRMNDFINEAFTALISEPYFYGGKYENLPEHLKYDLDRNVALHTIPGKLKKAEKLLKQGDHPVLQTYIALLNELMPLHNAQKELKGMVVAKKAAKVDEERQKEQKTTSLMNHEDVKRVKDVLIKVTNDLREKVLTTNYQFVLGVIDRWAAQYDPSDRRTGNYTVNARNPFYREIIAKAQVHKTSMRDPEELKPDYKESAREYAKKMTDEVLDHFINKQTAKMAEILYNKDNLKTITLKDARTGSGTIEGMLQLIFDDGSQFDVNNQLVWSMSKLGKVFYRFPTTFHRVKMPDGEYMAGKVSEQRMKDDFAT